ncbi:MAG: malonyl-CoA decarboxylase [Alphaproteobacteria bacterium]
MTEPRSRHLIGRALGRVRRAWRDVAGSEPTALAGSLRPELSDDDARRLKRQLDACLRGLGGEVSARAHAADLGQAYLELKAQGRARFLALLAAELRPDEAQVSAAIAALEGTAGEARVAAERHLRAVLEPPSVRLFTHFNALPQGVKFLVDLRADMLPLAKREPGIRTLEEDLKGLLTSWFDIGFLELERVTWDAAASLLEKLIAYEAVHAIRSWDDLKNRLDSDRRLYAFFHPGMPDEPLIFVEVALTSGLAGNIQELLDEAAPAQDPDAADSAIFYAISNAQAGLRGVSFGSFLIKRVVDDLARDLKGIKHFATLSPLPGFRAWLDGRIGQGDESLLGAAEARELGKLAGAESGAAALKSLLNLPEWPQAEATAEALRAPLLRLAARYLLAEPGAGRARDRVAHFHLTNGARIERINWLADRSEKGLDQSAGIMVNYRYRLQDIEANHEAYRGEGRIVASAAVRSLLKG